MTSQEAIAYIENYTWSTTRLGLERTRAMMERVDNLGVMTISTDDDGNWVVWSNHRFASLAVQ